MNMEMKDFESKYLTLRDENIELKKKKNEQEITIKRMYTKLAMIEATMKKNRIHEHTNNQLDSEDIGEKLQKPIPRKKDTESQVLIHTLKLENTQLKKKNQALVTKNQLLRQKLQQQRQFKTSYYDRSQSVSNSTKLHDKKIQNPLFKPLTASEKIHCDTIHADLEVELKKRLVTAEKLIIRLQHENKQLRNGHGKFTEIEYGSNNQDENTNVIQINKQGEMEQLQRELRDRQAQITLLNGRLEHLQASSRVERDIHEKTIEQMEVMNRQVHRLRIKLQDVSITNEELEIKASKADSCEKEVSTLREQNKRLEERMTTLCESPFINDAFQRKERIDRLIELEKKSKQQIVTIQQTADENHNLQLLVRELKSDIEIIKQNKENAEAEIRRLKGALKEKSSTQFISPEPSIIPIQPLRIETPEVIPVQKTDAASSPVHTEIPCESSIEITQIAEIKPLVNNVIENPIKMHISESDMYEEPGIIHLRNRVHVLQVAHLKALQELERCEKMLRTQTTLNRELALEIEDMTAKKVTFTDSLQKRINNLEAVIADKQQQILDQEAQIRQLKYSRHQLLRNADEHYKIVEEPNDSTDTELDDFEVASASESLVMAASDLPPGEQLLELFIISANYDNGLIDSSTSTLVMCDFFDFETQCTPLICGDKPNYNFSTIYKVVIDAFFLRYLASEMLQLEVYQAIRGDIRMVGVSKFRLSHLLKRKGAIKSSELSVTAVLKSPGESFSTDPQTVVGSLNVVLRLATPISEIWKLHLNSFPQDKKLLLIHKKDNPKDIQSTKRTQLNTADKLNVSQSQSPQNQELFSNELEITIFACRNLRVLNPAGKELSESPLQLPCTYVHYQFLGFPDVFTNIVPESRNPEYDLETSQQKYFLEMDLNLLKFLTAFRISFKVFDDQIDVSNSSDDCTNDGLLGESILDLEDLLQGEPIKGWFHLLNHDEQIVGEISICIQWREPTKILLVQSAAKRNILIDHQKEMHTLDIDQQYSLMTMLSPQCDGRVNYRHFIYMAYPSENLELLIAKIKERLVYALETQQIEKVSDIFCRDKCESIINAKPNHGNQELAFPAIVSIDHFKRIIEFYGVFLSQDETDMLLRIFGSYESPGNSIRESFDIDIPFLLLHINPTPSCAQRLLWHKIRHTMHRFMCNKGTNINEKESSAREIFSKFDNDACGWVSRNQFKSCLPCLGFELLDTEAEYQQFVHEKSALEDSKKENTAELTVYDNQNSLIETIPEVCKPNFPSLTIMDAESDNEIIQPNTTSRVTRMNIPDNLKPAVESTITQYIVASASTQKHATEDHDPFDKFSKRKQAFTDRIKAISLMTPKSLVYEKLMQQKELQRRKQHVNNVQANSKLYEHIPSLPTDKIEAKLEELQKRKHASSQHLAAQTLQQYYRKYKGKVKNLNIKSDHTQHDVKVNIVLVDKQLRNLFFQRKSDELFGLVNDIKVKIEGSIPDAKLSGHISRKQLGHIFTQFSTHLAIPPDCLYILMRYFTLPNVKQTQVVYRHLLYFIGTEITSDRGVHLREKIPQVFHELEKICIDAVAAVHVFQTVGDIHNTGVVSYKRFCQCLERLGIRLPKQTIQLMLKLFDWNGTDILYLAFLRMIHSSTTSLNIKQCVDKCHIFGLSKLKDILLLAVESDDGIVCCQDVQQVLADTLGFTHRDGAQLHQLGVSYSTSHGETSGKLSISNLVLAISYFQKVNKCSSTVNKLSSPSPNTEILSPYGVEQLQALLQNCRKYCKFTLRELVQSFERYDWRKSNHVSLQEFQYIVHHEYSVFQVLSEPQALQIAKLFGNKLDDQFGVNYTNFLEWTQPPAQLNVGNIEKKLREYAEERAKVLSDGHQQLTKVLELWRTEFLSSVVSPNKNQLSRRDFTKVCQKNLSLPLNMIEMKHVLDVLDNDMEDLINIQQFLQLDWTQKPSTANESAPKTVHFHKDVTPVRGRLGSASTKFSNTEDACALTIKEVQRLDIALTSALNRSTEKYKKSFTRFQEYCIAKKFRLVDSNKVWKVLQQIGMVDLLSRRGVALLLKKSLEDSRKLKLAKEVKNNENDSEDDEFKDKISLQILHDLLENAHSKLQKTQPIDQIQNSTVSNQQRYTTHDSQMEAVRDNSNQHLQKYRLHGVTNDKPISALNVLAKLLDQCDDNGVDIYAKFEEFDRNYTGCIRPTHINMILGNLGIRSLAQSCNYTNCEIIIDELIQLYHHPGSSNNVEVNYGVMLCHAHNYQAKVYYDSNDMPTCMPFQERWQIPMINSLRAKLRRIAGISGPLLHRDFLQNCKLLSAPFKMFDHDGNGCIRFENLKNGLSSLSYILNDTQVITIWETLCIFQKGYTQDQSLNNTISRVEFDAFVMNPNVHHFLRRMSKCVNSKMTDEADLVTEKHDRRGTCLGRLFLNKDNPKTPTGSLPLDVAVDCLSQVFPRKLTAYDTCRLQQLFDVCRNGVFSYRLFLRVMSKWYTDNTNVVSSANVDNSSAHVSDQEQNYEKKSIELLELLHVLHHQLSSVDFESQLEILHEYLKEKDNLNLGILDASDLHQVFVHLGLEMSKDAYTKLTKLFPPISDGEGTKLKGAVCYTELLQALKILDLQKTT